MQVHPKALFSIQPASGKRVRKRKKYRRDAIWPMIIKGCSTGMPPIHVRMATSAIRVQNSNWVTGRKVRPRCFDVWRIGTTMSTRMEARRARTPPSLLGMERRMA